MFSSYLSKDNYNKIINWHEFYNNNKSLKDIPFDLTWIIPFSKLLNDPRFMKLNNKLKNININNNEIKMYPYPRLVFNSFLITPLDKLKVVIIGQDPYFNCEMYNNDCIPQAMGLSFSVPHGCKIPSSLINIYKNLLYFGHIKKKPKSGNLWMWGAQGCLMLNTALTVIENKKKSHSHDWEWFTDGIIKYISDNTENIVFLLWGSDAKNKLNLIDTNKHKTIISSHPSGLSVDKYLGKYPPFKIVDHFGETNKYLKKHNKESIIWDV